MENKFPSDVRVIYNVGLGYSFAVVSDAKNIHFNDVRIHSKLCFPISVLSTVSLSQLIWMNWISKKYIMCKFQSKSDFKRTISWKITHATARKRTSPYGNSKCFSMRVENSSDNSCDVSHLTLPFFHTFGGLHSANYQKPEMVWFRISYSLNFPFHQINASET